MDYAALIPLLAFFAAVHLAVKLNVRPTITSFVAVALPYIVTLVTAAITAALQDRAILESLFFVPSIVVVVLQYLIGLFVFKKIRDTEGIAAAAAWVIGGFILLVLLIPYAVAGIM